MSLKPALALLLATACRDAAAPRAPSVAAPPPTTVENGIDWYDDAIDAAFTAAKRTGKPVFLDVWAGWCTPCRQMRATVITGDKLPAEKDPFVFLAVDESGALALNFWV